MNQKDEIICELNREIVGYKDDIDKVNEVKVDNEKLPHNSSLLNKEMNEYEAKIFELSEKCASKTMNADKQENIINTITAQLKEVNDSKKKLESNLSTLINTNKSFNVDNVTNKNKELGQNTMKMKPKMNLNLFYYTIHYVKG